MCNYWEQRGRYTMGYTNLDLDIMYTSIIALMWTFLKYEKITIFQKFSVLVSNIAILYLSYGNVT